ncbi:hypothetical protein SDC9_149379 [bioreactor metagenome]|uniref:Uncharacterized protein n=1 Tax=bioreactor metagenome TaxID=1076179 RepID=A0A645EL14_9ZZZZ
MDDGLECLRKLGAESRLTVSADGHMTQLKQFIRQMAVPGTLTEASFADISQSPFKFRGEDIDVKLFLAIMAIAMDLAIETAEIA